VDATVRELRACGLEFDEFDLPRLKTVEGIATVDEWAGTEIAERWMGYVDGAIESGIRAAVEVLEGDS
jgi:hypothetical protein